jgi:hypothetical protein
MEYKGKRFTCACVCDCVYACVCATACMRVCVRGVACARHKSFSLAPGVSAAWLKHAFSALQVNASPLMPPLTHSYCVPLMGKCCVCFGLVFCSCYCSVPFCTRAPITTTPFPTWPPADPSVNHGHRSFNPTTSTTTTIIPPSGIHTPSKLSSFSTHPLCVFNPLSRTLRPLPWVCSLHSIGLIYPSTKYRSCFHGRRQVKEYIGMDWHANSSVTCLYVVEEIGQWQWW